MLATGLSNPDTLHRKVCDRQSSNSFPDGAGRFLSKTFQRLIFLSPQCYYAFKMFWMFFKEPYLELTRCKESNRL